MEKPTFGEKFRALLATGRVANLPTVWSNVLVGFWIASFFISQYSRDDAGHTLRIALLYVTLFNASLIYIGGCMLGDALDLNFDKKHRSNRPLPRGVISVSAVKFTAYSLLTLALFGIFSSTFISVVIAEYLTRRITFQEILGLFTDRSTLNAVQLHEMILGCLLIACVTIYAFHHKKNKRFALILMASCRFMLVILAIGVAQKTFFIVGYTSHTPLGLYTDWITGWMLILAFSVGAYTLLLSWVASTESDQGAFKARKILCGALLGLPALTFLFQEMIFLPDLPVRTIWATINQNDLWQEKQPYAMALFLALGILYIWLFYTLRALKTSKPTFVSRALAGFCLLDACFVAAFAPGIAAVCVVLFALALLLQRVAPAT